MYVTKDGAIQLIDDATFTYWNDQGWEEYGDAPSGTSSAAGSPVVRAFPFAFDTPGLVTGHTVYTPTVGDVLLDAWLQVDVAWDGTTPKCDYGPFFEQNFGLFVSSTTIPLTVADTEAVAGLANQANAVPSSGTGLLSQLGFTGVGVPAEGSFGQAVRVVPAKFTAAHPFKVCVSTDGTTDGDDPGATQGAAVLYLVTVTPAT